MQECRPSRRRSPRPGERCCPSQSRPWLPYPEDVSGEREFDVVLESTEEGGFVVSVPDLPGCWTQGETRDEALANAKEAIGAYLDALDELGRPLHGSRDEGFLS